MIEQMLRDNIEIPEHLASPPELHRGLELYLGAFNDLTSSRVVGMSVGQIPWGAIADYCTVNEITGVDRDDLFYHVGCLDSEYLAHVEKKSKLK